MEKRIFKFFLFFSILLLSTICVYTQGPVCPNVYITRPGQSVQINEYYVCDSGNINIEAHPFNVGSSEQYTVSSIPYNPPFPFNAGTPVPGQYADDTYHSNFAFLVMNINN